MSKDKIITIYKGGKSRQVSGEKELARFTKYGWSQDKNGKFESDEIKVLKARIKVLESSTPEEKAAFAKPLDKMNKQELLAKAELEGIQVDEKATNKALVFAIGTALGLLDEDGNEVKKELDV